jgi:hypothetical protein
VFGLCGGVLVSRVMGYWEILVLLVALIPNSKTNYLCIIDKSQVRLPGSFIFRK